MNHDDNGPTYTIEAKEEQVQQAHLYSDFNADVLMDQGLALDVPRVGARCTYTNC